MLRLGLETSLRLSNNRALASPIPWFGCGAGLFWASKPAVVFAQSLTRIEVIGMFGFFPAQHLDVRTQLTHPAFLVASFDRRTRKRLHSGTQWLGKSNI
jgi:hypothetical protein